MEISPKQVKALRDATGAPMMDCKAALQHAKGNIDLAKTKLREKGLEKARTKSSRATRDGVVASYIHGGGKIGVLVEVNCETDFVARTDRFQVFVEDLSMHIAAAAPKYLSQEDVPQDIIAQEEALYRTQAENSGKPEKIVPKLIEGKMKKFFEEVCLLNQPFIKDPDKSIQTIVSELVAVLGENVTIRRFTRYQLGDL